MDGAAVVDEEIRRGTAHTEGDVEADVQDEVRGALGASLCGADGLAGACCSVVMQG